MRLSIVKFKLHQLVSSMEYERLHRRKKKISYSWSLGTRFLPGEVPIGAFDHCFNCGKSGHWKESCPKHRHSSFKNDHSQKSYGVSNDRTVTNKRQHNVNWHHAWAQDIFSIFQSLSNGCDESKHEQKDTNHTMCTNQSNNQSELNTEATSSFDSMFDAEPKAPYEEKELNNRKNKITLTLVRKSYSSKITKCTFEEFVARRLEAAKTILVGNSCRSCRKEVEASCNNCMIYWRCIFCSKRFKGGYGKIKKHIEVKHLNGLDMPVEEKKDWLRFDRLICRWPYSKYSFIPDILA